MFYSDNHLDLLSFVDTLLIAANIVGIFHIEELIDIGLLRRHVDNNFLTRRRAASSERYRRTEGTSRPGSSSIYYLRI